MQEYLLGIDIGTGGCKVTLIDCDGNFIASGTKEYPTYHPQLGWSEQNAEDWMSAVVASLQIIKEKSSADFSKIACVCVDASAHNAVLLDENDNVLRPTIMWTDQRSAEEAAFLKEKYGDEIFRIGYQVPNPTWTIAQLLWIRKNEPQVFEKIHRIMFIKDYVRYQMTGTWETDHIEAQGSLLFDNISHCWSEELCDMCGLPIRTLPPLVAPTDVVGKITAEGARITGLAIGTPVINGAPDTALESYCVGAIRENCCVVKLATAGTVNYFRKEANPDPKALTYSHVVKGLWYTCLSTSSAAASLRWFRDTFCTKELDEERAGGQDVYQLLDKEAEVVLPGSEGLIFHPHLMGERSPYWDSKLRASFVGITSKHKRSHFARSLLEGVAFSVNDNFLSLKESPGIKDIRIVGGGAKSPLWCDIMSNVLNRPLTKYQHDDSSMGSAILAGVGIGVFSSHEAAVSKCLKVKAHYEPDSEIAAKYAEYFSLYKEIHGGLVETYHKM